MPTYDTTTSSWAAEILSTRPAQPTPQPPQAGLQEYQVGDRVRSRGHILSSGLVSTAPDEARTYGAYPGEEGVVTRIGRRYSAHGPWIGVRWDTYRIGRHNLDGTVENGHGYNVYAEALELISRSDVDYTAAKNFIKKYKKQREKKGYAKFISDKFPLAGSV